ncbi:MAG: hypothetical protein RL385_2010 [Pseudomonadota bacterium]
MTPALWRKFFTAIGAFFALLQLVPYGRSHENPPVRQEPVWDSPETRALAKRTCFDCHSNESTWPWYSHVAPVSWLVQHDVDEGREHLNFSEFDRPQRHAEDAAESVEEGEMPMAVYLPLHPEARLSPTEKAALVQGLMRTLGAEADVDQD